MIIKIFVSDNNFFLFLFDNASENSAVIEYLKNYLIPTLDEIISSVTTFMRGSSVKTMFLKQFVHT